MRHVVDRTQPRGKDVEPGRKPLQGQYTIQQPTLTAAGSARDSSRRNMRTKQQASAILVLVFSLLLSSCGAGQLLGPTQTPSPTNTPLPTDTPLPTNTPIPTDTLPPVQESNPEPTQAQSGSQTEITGWIEIFNSGTVDTSQTAPTALNQLVIFHGPDLNGSGFSCTGCYAIEPVVVGLKVNLPPEDINGRDIIFRPGDTYQYRITGSLTGKTVDDFFLGSLPIFEVTYLERVK